MRYAPYIGFFIIAYNLRLWIVKISIVDKKFAYGVSLYFLAKIICQPHIQIQKNVSFTTK